MSLSILADENIPYVREAFATLGEVSTMPGRMMKREHLAKADILLVRSVTKVNAELLEGTPVRFVATATIGEDHIDKNYLAHHGIGFASAPGSNADSVADMVSGILVGFAEILKFSLEGKSIGIVGVGNVGSRVEQRARALGMKCVLNDPPLANEIGGERFSSMEEIQVCDVITFHVPLTKEGRYKTKHMVDVEFLSKLSPETLIINTARGAVIDNKALCAAIRAGRPKYAALDVWEGEPRIDRDLLELTVFGSPHIAGYSFDGKVNGTEQIYHAVCAFLDKAPEWNPAPLLPAPDCPAVHLTSTLHPQFLFQQAIDVVYDFRRDDKALRGILSLTDDEAAAQFDRLRKEYPIRREFKNTLVRLNPPNEELSRRFVGLGFAPEQD